MYNDYSHRNIHKILSNFSEFLQGIKVLNFMIFLSLLFSLMSVHHITFICFWGLYRNNFNRRECNSYWSNSSLFPSWLMHQGWCCWILHLMDVGIHAWWSRFILISLSAKNKLGFIDGSYLSQLRTLQIWKPKINVTIWLYLGY